MSKVEKLLARLRNRPKDFTWSELTTLISGCGFAVHMGSGSSRKFVNPQTGAMLVMHEPHPGNILKAYQVRAALDLLKQEGYIQ